MGSRNLNLLWTFINYVAVSGLFNYGSKSVLTVKSFLDCLFEKLSPKENMVLKYCSVIGEEFDQKILERILPPKIQDDAQSCLDKLTSMGLIYILKHGLYCYQSTIMRENIYESIPARYIIVSILLLCYILICMYLYIYVHL
jgi:hypothetical protein